MRRRNVVKRRNSAERKYQRRTLAPAFLRSREDSSSRVLFMIARGFDYCHAHRDSILHDERGIVNKSCLVADDREEDEPLSRLK